MKFGTHGPLDLQIDFGSFSRRKFVRTTPPKPKVIETWGFHLALAYLVLCPF